MEVNKIQEHLAKKLRFQIVAFLVLGIVYARGAWNTFGVLFLAANSGHTCDPSEINVADSPKHANRIDNASLLNYSIVTGSWIKNFEGEARKVIASKECDLFVQTKNGSNITVPCERNWIYSTEFESTIVSEWNLVCVRAYLTELSTTLYMVGSMFGALLITPVSDRFGRRLTLLFCLLAQAVIGSCVALAPTYAIFTALRFVVGFFNMGIALCAYVLMTETFPADKRSIPCTGFQVFWACGLMMTALFGYIVRDWRHLQLIFSLPNIACAILVWFLPESLPWLIAKKQLRKAQNVAEKISKLNSIAPPCFDMYETISMSNTTTTTCEQSPPSCDDRLQNVQYEAACLLPDSTPEQNTHKTGNTSDQSDQGNESIIANGSNHSQAPEQDVQVTANTCGEFCQVTGKKTLHLKHFLMLFVRPRMRLYSLIILYLFFVNSLSYFGISLSTPVLHGNQFFNLFLLGAMEIPAYIICVYVCQRVGRKVPLCVFLLMCGVMNIIAMLISEEASKGMSGIRIAFVMLGKFAITGGYSTVYLYAAEVFPTAVRNQAIGLSSFFENFGSIAAPFLLYAARSHPELPMILFGIVSIMGGLMVLALPETHRKPLPQTVEEVESWGMTRRRRRV